MRGADKETVDEMLARIASVPGARDHDGQTLPERLVSVGPEYVAWVLTEGGRESDIAWYAAVPNAIRYFFNELANIDATALFISLRKRGLDPKAATQEIRATHPRYGVPAEDSDPGDPDRRLPWELKNRIDAYIAVANPQVLIDEVNAVGLTFNAFARREIAAGNI